MADDVLRLENLVTEIASDQATVRVVDGVSVSVRRGRTLGLVGESGSGKSLTCLSILGLLPAGGRVASGRILFRGEDLAGMSQRNLSRYRGTGIGTILQDPMTSLNPLLTIGDQIGEVFRYHHGISSAAERRRRAVAVMEQVRIPAAAERLNAYPHQFSGGMRQRIAIAMSIAADPGLIIADEPTTALDVTIRLQILQLLRDIQRERGTAILLVTHDLHAVARFCDDVAVMYAGRIVEQGPVAEVFARPAHPYTVGLVAAVPRIAVIPERLATIPGQPPRPGESVQGCAFAPRCARASAGCLPASPAPRSIAPGRSVACIAPHLLAEAAE
ncbi:ABC transporter ATP-binding protein [Xanthobacter autotrophicus DSM 431]|uniref:ABC transporter ATP-binding protein n=1 Tax=Xanthobacter nonsaccharivorans TaxID=3119912 RepID=UPI00372CA19E